MNVHNMIIMSSLPTFCECIRAAAYKLLIEILNEINKNRLERFHIYCAARGRYLLMPRYTFLQQYKLLLQKFNLLSVSYIRKLKQDNMDPEKRSTVLRNQGKNKSRYNFNVWQNIFFQKSQEFIEGTMVGCNDNGDSFKWILFFRDRSAWEKVFLSISRQNIIFLSKVTGLLTKSGRRLDWLMQQSSRWLLLFEWIKFVHTFYFPNSFCGYAYWDNRRLSNS